MYVVLLEIFIRISNFDIFAFDVLYIAQVLEIFLVFFKKYFIPSFLNCFLNVSYYIYSSFALACF